MKRMSMLFGILLGLQLLAGEASATSVLVCDFDAKYNRQTGQPIGKDLNSLVAGACDKGPMYVSKVEFSRYERNTLSVEMRYRHKKDYENDYQDSEVYSLRFPDLASAQKFLSNHQQGRMAAVAFRPMEDYMAYDAKNTIVVLRTTSSGVSQKSILQSLTGLLAVPVMPLF